ncbi:PIG-L family deacetylase [Umezawaea beigongshangensis]|uniref:PIG-L family deacetylase n=1 Tax=Umezawaea beigongshangensis TaxID=2780383 RepID=UPI0018F21417|nr:PIG-L family deacetylase [Umezawaea beigongshangensis]
MTGSTERVLTVVAHQDDDLIFINPQVSDGVRRRVPTRTVFVTAGEYNGNDTTREIYAAQRREGVCAAYAAITGGRGPWLRTARTFAGVRVEVSVRPATPNVELVFLCLPDGGDDLQLDALTRLRADPKHTARTIVMPRPAPVQQSHTYTAETLRAVLLAIVRDFAPTTVHVQDCDPDPQLPGDHADHIATAHFAREVVEELYAPRARTRPLLVQHRDYATEGCEENLTSAVVAEKQSLFETYAAHDSGAGTLPYVWLRRTYRRWPLGTAWIAADGAGRLHAFCVQGGAVWHRRQFAAGRPFAAAVPLGGDVAATLAAARTADGRVAVFGVHQTTHDVVVNEQLPTGGFAGWRSLGNPNGPGGRHTGAPAVGTTADGRLQVFAKNSGGGVSTIHQTSPGGAFTPWSDLGGGPDVRGTPVCVSRPDGRAVLFAATRTGIRCWTWTPAAPGWVPTTDVVTNDAVTCSPTAALHADGRVAVFWRGLAGEVRTVHELTAGGAWSSTPESLGNPGGLDDVAVLRAPGANGRIFLLAGDAHGGVSAAAQVAPRGGCSGWVRLGGRLHGSPALVLDRTGHPVACHFTADGKHLVTTPVEAPELS